MRDFIELVAVDAKESNPFANERTCGNGGGYFQPSGWAILRVGGRYLMATFADYSCGDFGSRISLEVISGRDHFYFNFGTMDDFHNEVHSINEYEGRREGQRFLETFGIKITDFYPIIRDVIYDAAYAA